MTSRECCDRNWKARRTQLNPCCSSYAGLWALRNPFTELAELTHGMSFLHNDLDRDIVDTVTGQNTSKRVIDFDQPAATVASAQSPMLLYKYNQNKLHAEELDFEYGFAKKVQLQRQRRRKAMVLSLLLGERRHVPVAVVDLLTLMIRSRDRRPGPRDHRRDD